MVEVPVTKVLVPSLLSNVPSPTVSELPLRPDTTPETRSKPPPCTLLPASTCVAANDTDEFVVEVVAVLLVVVGVEPLAHTVMPFVVLGVEPSEQILTLTLLVGADPLAQVVTPLFVVGVEL